MAEIENEMVDIQDLYLDSENPRFIIPPKATQADIVRYLVDFEDVLQLVNDINRNSGLLAGERIIGYRHHEKVIVLEGNRRVCACKIILNNSLVPPHKISFLNGFFPSSTTLDNIMQLSVDILPDRMSAQSALASKHIDGIKKWSVLSKMKFYSKSFDSKWTLEEIAIATDSEIGRIQSSIKDYRLFEYALNLPNWNENERIDPQFVKVNRYLKFLKNKYSNDQYEPKNQSLLQLLGLTYNNRTFDIFWGENENIVKNCIYLVARESLANKSGIGTRNKLDDIPDLVSLLLANNIIIRVTNQISIDEIEPLIAAEETSISNFQQTSAEESSMPISQNDSENNTNSVSGSTEIRPKSDAECGLSTGDQNRPVTPAVKMYKFFQNLDLSKIDRENPDNLGLLKTGIELRAISICYKKYPISCAILLRSFIEQLLKFYLRNNGKLEYLKNGNNGKSPPLEKIIDYINKNSDSLFARNDNLRRSFSVFFSDKIIKDYLDMIIHNPHLISPHPETLDIICCSAGFIHEMLDVDCNTL